MHYVVTRHMPVAALLLAAADRPLRTTACARVGPRALSAQRQTAAVTDATIRTDIHQTLDIHRDLAAKVTLNANLFVNQITQSVGLVVRQIANTGVRADLRPLEQLLAGVKSDAIDVGQCYLNTLLARQVDTRNSGHVFTSIHAIRYQTQRRWYSGSAVQLTLSLLMPGVRANNANDTLPANDAAALASLAD
jgi:hypothetical protein